MFADVLDKCKNNALKDMKNDLELRNACLALFFVNRRLPIYFHMECCIQKVNT